MRTAGLALLIASLAPAVLADDLTRTATGDIDGDGVPDRVEIRPSDAGRSTVDIKVSLSASERIVQVRTFAAAEYVAPPAIDDARGEVHLTFEWLSGRYKSVTNIYLGLQNRDLVIRRYRRGVGDGMASGDNPLKVQSCDVDYVAHRATRNDKPVAAPGRAISLAAWKEDSVPTACRF
jgi:hypothetical protein